MTSPDTLHPLACAARERAHAPYSAFRVGVALLASDGTVFQGCNVENASFGLTICAERAAVCSAVAAGQTSFERILIVTDNAATPCGACLQVLREFAEDLTVDLATPEGVQRTLRLSELLPHGFPPGMPGSQA